MKTCKCTQCGFVGFAETDYCKRCGSSLLNRSSVEITENYKTARELQDGLAIAALVIGIISLFTLGLFVVGAVVGVVLAVKAIKKVDTEPARYSGRGLALSGLSLCLVSLIGSAFVLGTVGPNVYASYNQAVETARVRGIEDNVIKEMREIAAAEVKYQARHRQYGTLAALGSEGLIDPDLAAGTKGGYNFYVGIGEDEDYGFHCSSEPAVYRTTGRRTFYIDNTLVLRGADKLGMIYGGGKFDPPVR